MPPVGIETITDNHSAIGAGLRIFALVRVRAVGGNALDHSAIGAGLRIFALVRVRAVSGNALDHSAIREGPGIFD